MTRAKFSNLARPAAVFGGAALCLALVGCETVNRRPKVDLAPTVVRPLPVVAVAPINNGAIFQHAQYRPLFEDHRARMVGDALTVRIAEKVSATQSSVSSVDKKGSVKAGISAIPFFSANSFNRASATGSSANSFEGKGSTENSNDFSGTITALVTDVLPNGHLLIAGEKQVGVNHNVDILRFTGQVDPRAIQPGNVVASAQIANVRIENRGRGAQADAQGIAWLSRFFLSVLPI
ncbi:flagellar basal body L-ring protein FlgH [Piscinibacter sakaiensis]|uniref:flagellar basal body L-ring protein FlgH n=1 Tax=Piscinibacter sakaiensis TaxID=1547922 RepID=UPI003AAD5C28